MAIIFVGAVTFSSCEKHEVKMGSTSEQAEPITDIQQKLPDVTAENGILKFNSPEVFFDAVEILNNADENSFTAWEQKNGFLSIRTQQNIALDELDAITSEAELNDWLEKYSNLFKKIINDDGEEEIVPIIDDIFYSSICNANQVYAVENSYYLIKNNSLFLIEDLSDASLSYKELSEKYESFKLEKENLSKDAPTQHIATAIRDERGCRNDRKVKIKNYLQKLLYFNDGIYYYRINVVTETRGYTREGTCAWRPYKTTLNYREVKGKVNYNQNSQKNFYIPDKTRHYVRYISGSYTITNGSTTSRNVAKRMLSNVYFRKDYGEASSRGVDDLWAIIKYHY